MSDLLEKLWPAFVSEVTEQLDSVELLLAKSTADKTPDVNQLFRNFHTIKGSCSMVGFSSMEAIAHRSEDILAMVRANEISFSDSVIDILLQAVACLKKQFYEANDSRNNPEPNEALLRQLDDFIAGNTAAAEPASLNPEQTHEQLAQLQQAAKLAVPSLVLGLDANAKAAQIEPAVETMLKKTEPLGFRALARGLSHYLALLQNDFADKVSLLQVTAELFNDMSFVAKDNDVDLSLALGAKLCQSKLQKDYQQQLQALQTLLEALASTEPEKWQAEQFIELVALADKLGYYSVLFLYTELAACWRYIKQLVVELSRSYIVFNHGMIESINAIANKALQGEPDSRASKEVAQMLEQLQFVTAKCNHLSDDVLALKESILSKSTLQEAALSDLGQQVLNDILQQLEQGKQALEIDLDFREEALAEKVLATVQQLGDLMHSRTLFHDFVDGVAQRTSFSLLIVSDKSLENIKAILNAIDREQQVFTILAASASSNENNTTTAEPDETFGEDEEKAVTPLQSKGGDDDTNNLVQQTQSSLGTLKVSGQDIDQLIVHIGELINSQHRLSHLLDTEYLQQQAQQLLQISHALLDPQLQQNLLQMSEWLLGLGDASEHLQNNVQRVQSDALGLRVVPIAYVFDRFHGFVRNIAKRLNKTVQLEVIGEHVKIDKAMVDILSEPLAHMVRNSIDHGLETAEQRIQAAKPERGLVTLKAEQHSSMVNIDIIDDGKGLDKDKILARAIEKGLLQKGQDYTEQQIFQMIFEPGFSTTESLSETSGRGVGMDVVRNNISQVGGSVSVSSEKGKGTTVRLRLPISAAIQSVILLQYQQQVFAVPERFVREVITVDTKQFEILQGQRMMPIRDALIPVFALSELLTENKAKLQEKVEVLVIDNEQGVMAVVVDSTIGRADILVRESHGALKTMPGVSGASILGDGQVVIILDCETLFDLADKKSQH